MEMVCNETDVAEIELEVCNFSAKHQHIACLCNENLQLLRFGLDFSYS